MCGICGFVGEPLHIDRQAMLSSLNHRGPDDTGEFEDQIPEGRVWFGHKRLSIIDLSPKGHQPMTSPDGRLTITFNGEIYNYQKIKETLEKDGYKFFSNSDTEVILAGWHKWGVSCLNSFRGMFAFAIWDRDDQSLWLARDRLGEKPLYYILMKNRFIFSSEIKTILNSNVVERRICSDGLDSYLAFGSVSQPYTIIKSVKCLEAGQWLKYNNGNLVTNNYWSLRNIKERDSFEQNEQVELEIYERFREALINCMVSDVSVGILLSGGVDSTANLSLLSKEKYSNLKSFTVVFEGEDIGYRDEYWSTKVSKRFQTDHKKVYLSIEDAQKNIPEAVNWMDQPSIDGCQDFMICKAIANSGYKVAVTGLGSDELFLGYNSRLYYPLLLKLSKVLNYYKFNVPLNLISNDFFTKIFPNMTHRVKKLQNISGDGDCFALAYTAYKSIFNFQEIKRMLGQNRVHPSRFVPFMGGTSPLGVLSRLELSHYMKNTLLRDTDQMSMACSMELRTPFLDHNFVEKIVSLPSKNKLAKDLNKPLLVRAINDNLLNEIAKLPKSGFELPLKKWLIEGHEFQFSISNSIGIEKKELDKIYKDYKIGKNYIKYWSILVLSNWFNRMRMLPPN